MTLACIAFIAGMMASCRSSMAPSPGIPRQTTRMMALRWRVRLAMQARRPEGVGKVGDVHEAEGGVVAGHGGVVTRVRGAGMLSRSGVEVGRRGVEGKERRRWVMTKEVGARVVMVMVMR